MLDLREIGVGVAVIDQSVKELCRFPDGLVAFLKRKIFLLLAENVVDGLVLVVQAVKLGYTWGNGGVVLAELLLAFAFFVATGKESVPFFEVV
jgi:hypothetical protein